MVSECSYLSAQLTHDPHPNPPLRCSRNSRTSLSGFDNSSPLHRVCVGMGLLDILQCLHSLIPIFSWIAMCRPMPSKFLAICPLGISSKEGFFLDPPNIHSYLYSGRRLLLQILEIRSFPHLASLKMVWVFVSPTVRLFFLLMHMPSASY